MAYSCCHLAVVLVVHLDLYLPRRKMLAAPAVLCLETGSCLIGSWLGSTGFLPTAPQALISHLSQGSDSLVLFQTSLTTWYCTCGHLPVTCSAFLLRGTHVLYFPLLTLDSWSGFRAVLQVVYIRQSWSGIPALQWIHSLNSWSHVDGC